MSDDISNKTNDNMAGLVRALSTLAPEKNRKTLLSALSLAIAVMSRKSAAESLESVPPSASKTAEKDTQSPQKTSFLSKDTFMENNTENQNTDQEEDADALPPIPPEMLKHIRKHLEASGLSKNLIEHLHQQMSGGNDSENNGGKNLGQGQGAQDASLSPGYNPEAILAAYVKRIKNQ